MNSSEPNTDPILNPDDQVQADEGTQPEQSMADELAMWKDLAMRRAADVENIRRRAAQDKEYLVSYATEHFITKMLPVVDDLHNAVHASETTSDLEALRAGLRMIYDKAVKIMADAGVKIIEGGAGEPFNVDVHEALMHMPSELPEGHIVQTVQRGYSLHDKVLRHAKVITSAGILDAHQSSEASE